MSTDIDRVAAAPADSIDERRERVGARLAAAGGVLGALGASTCCILPLVLFGLGIGGAWIGRLTALAPYQPLFILLALGSLGYGYWLVYRGADSCQGAGTSCTRPPRRPLVKGMLWGSTLLVLLALAWPWVVPLLLS